MSSAFVRKLYEKICGRLLIVLSSVLSITPEALAIPNSSPTDDEVQSQGKALLVAGNFREFDERASSYRTTKARTREGYARLTMLYAAVDDICPTNGNDPSWTVVENKASAWIRKYPSSATAIVVAAQIKLQHAQKARGEESADETSNAALERFEQLVGEAQIILDTGKKVGSLDPSWYGQRLQVANYQGDDKERILQLVDEGLATDDGFFNIYYDALDGLIPRWGGSPLLVQRLIRIADKHKSDGAGGQYYARLAYRMIRAYGRKEFDQDGMSWSRVQTSYNEVISAYPDPWNLNNYAAMACAFEDGNVLHLLLEKIGKDTQPEAWFRRPGYMDQCIAGSEKRTKSLRLVE